VGSLTPVAAADGKGLAGEMDPWDGVMERPQDRMIPAETGRDFVDAPHGGARGFVLRMPDWMFLRARRIAYCVRLLADHLYDFRRNIRWSSAVDRGDSKAKLAALVTMAQHSLEKGLSLRDSRPGFGPDHVRLLIGRVERYLDHCGEDQTVWNALNVLEEYCLHAERSGVDVAHVREALERLRGQAPAGAAYVPGGTREVSREDVHRQAKVDLGRFFASRSSIRSFTDEEVDLELIEAAVRMAQKTPSVCNRQSSRIRVLKDPVQKQEALRIQGGSRGFGDQVDKVLIVTSDISHFQASGERNQGWIDGGLFAMSVIYALHSLGLGTCALNWSKDRSTDREFRAAIGVPESESIIMLIAVGHLPDRFRVAQSPTKPLSEALVVE
jgi:nitroreductase